MYQNGDMLIKGLNGRAYKVTSFKRWLIDWDNLTGSTWEVRTKEFLKPYWSNEIVCSEYRIPGSLQRIDVFTPSLGVVIEISPRSSHGQYNEFLHGSLSGYRDRIKRDLQKESWAQLNGFKFCEIVDSDFPLTPELFEERFGVVL